MAKKSLFSPTDLYHMADAIVEMYNRMNLIYKLAVAEDNKEVMQAYNGIVVELELLIQAYGLKEMTKIN